MVSALLYFHQARIATLRRSAPVLRQSIASCRSYHSYEDESRPPFPEPETALLSAAYSHVPSQGFTETALTLGAKDAGYLDVSVNLFPRGVFDLVNYHLVTQRLALKDRVQFSEDSKMGIGGKVRLLTLERLRANAPIIDQWPQALAIMAKPSNVPPSLTELAKLADEIWFLAGDVSVDSSWYTKRASLSAIYSSTELFMTQDKSPEYKETEQFLDRRLEDLRNVGGGLSDVGEWLSFNASALVNVARSKGFKI